MTDAKTIFTDARLAYRSSTAMKATSSKPPAVFGLNPIEDYKTKYKRVGHYSKGDPIGQLFGTGRASHEVPLVERTPRIVLTGISSFDPDFLRFLRELADGSNKIAPASVDAENFTSTGVHTTFDRIKCPAGFMQSPMSAKTVDNRLLRKEMGLSEGYSPEQRRIATAVWRLVWAKCKPSSVNVPPMSQGGMPRFTHDTQWKLDYANWKYSPNNYDRFLNFVERGNVYGLLNRFETLYGMYTQKRLQVDEPSKARYANDWLYAISGGAKGQRIRIDKRVVIGGTEYPDFSPLRVRVIDAGPWTINCDLSAISTSHMRGLFERYPGTFHVNTAAEIVGVVNNKYVYCSDVSEYDQSMSYDALNDIPFTTMKEYYPEGICISALRLMEAPYFSRPLELGGTKGRWIASPLDWSFCMRSGNRSGHAFTSLIAKVNKVIDTLFVIGKIYPVTEDNVESYLQGRMPMGMVNNGDDEIVWATTRSDIQRYRALRADPLAGHYSITPEVGQGFSGLLLVRPDPNEPKYSPQARLQTAFEKMYVPERSIGTRLRKYWPVGFRERERNLRQTDVGRELWEYHKWCFAKHLESRFGSYNSIVERGFRDVDIATAGLSQIDLDVLIDPEKLHYAYHEDEVSETVLRQVTSRIPVSVVEGFLRRYYKGTFI